jgi:hypothetical protein
MANSLYTIAGGDPRPVSGLNDTDILAHWSADERSVLAYRRAEIPCRLDRVDLATGHRAARYRRRGTGTRTHWCPQRYIVLPDAVTDSCAFLARWLF